MKEQNLNKMISAQHDPELYDIISRFLEQDVHEADQLSVTERHLCVLSALMGCQGKEAFMAEMHEAMKDGSIRSPSGKRCIRLPLTLDWAASCRFCIWPMR